jgi:hypothetical protein
VGEDKDIAAGEGSPMPGINLPKTEGDPGQQQHVYWCINDKPIKFLKPQENLPIN